ncbi:hypothetical protein BASA82_000065 [Batrachochytrium salamandrivorans]|nr:hypothetical protein BASA82_000065 [Batrachochytrium salamandrivorans]
MSLSILGITYICWVERKRDRIRAAQNAARENAGVVQDAAHAAQINAIGFYLENANQVALGGLRGTTASHRRAAPIQAPPLMCAVFRPTNSLEEPFRIFREHDNMLCNSHERMKAATMPRELVRMVRKMETLRGDVEGQEEFATNDFLFPHEVEHSNADDGLASHLLGIQVH